MNGEYVFSLDIGTRTVIGLVGKYEDGVLKILGSDKLEHRKRAMYDGQIHDINSVAEIAGQVKSSLEEKTGIELKHVSIAAAGRSLKTVKSKVTVPTDISKEIEKRDIKSAELEAIQVAQKTLDEDSQDKNKYHCVGYSVIKSYLDDVLIENLEGHRGDNITLELIATFLPYTVMNSLYSVMDRIGLEVENITLEPIAAMEVAIKQNLRLLNLALVDVGAGTSDIAITREGTVFSYDMVPIAGDEITEAIINKYLLDYDEAEKLKLKLRGEETISYSDIMGIGYQKEKSEILEDIRDSIETLADEIASRILSINGKSPSAVFLIGGGAQVPNLDIYIAEKLELPKERVAVRDTSIIDDIEGIDENLKHSDGITPIGIAVNSAKSSYKNFIEVSVNGQNVKMFNSGSPKILDLMFTIGYNPRNLVPERGKSVSYYLNGVKQTALGEPGENAEIYADGKPVDMEHVLKDKEQVVIKEATRGADKVLKLSEAVDLEKHIVLNGERMPILKSVSLNGETKHGDYEIKDGDSISFERLNTVVELALELGLSAEKCEFYNEDGILSLDHEFVSGESVFYDIKRETFDDSDVIEEIAEENIVQDGKQEDGKSVSIVLNGKQKTISHGRERFKFVDIFEYIDFDTSRPKGSLNLKLNGQNAEYLKDIKNGDVVEIYWGSADEEGGGNEDKS